MLKDILRFDNNFIGRFGQMTEEEVSLRFRHCPTTFYCILESVVGGTNLCGYFVILPLTVMCAAAVRRGEVTVGKQISTTDLVQPDETCESAYLSVVCAVGARARSALIASVIQVVRNLYTNRGTRYLFARAVTAAGARVLTRLTGQRFVPDGIIHEIDVSRYSVITASE